MPIVYAKTAKGAEEYLSRAHRLHPRLRTVLILVNGQRSDVHLVQMLPHAAEGIVMLLEGGFIHPLPSMEDVTPAAHNLSLAASSPTGLAPFDDSDATLPPELGEDEMNGWATTLAPWEAGTELGAELGVGAGTGASVGAGPQAGTEASGKAGFTAGIESGVEAGSQAVVGFSHAGRQEAGAQLQGAAGTAQLATQGAAIATAQAPGLPAPPAVVFSLRSHRNGVQPLAAPRLANRAMNGPANGPMNRHSANAFAPTSKDALGPAEFSPGRTEPPVVSFSHLVPQARFERQLQELVRLFNAQCGPAGDLVALKLQSARSAQQLRPHLREAALLVDRLCGRDEAEVFAQQAERF